jgi:hypothetical protein
MVIMAGQGGLRTNEHVIRSKTVRDWYEGKFVPHENDPDSNLRFIGGDYERHWTARVARVLIAFWLEHWKWIIGVIVALAALIVNARK